MRFWKCFVRSMEDGYIGQTTVLSFACVCVVNQYMIPCPVASTECPILNVNREYPSDVWVKSETHGIDDWSTVSATVTGWFFLLRVCVYRGGVGCQCVLASLTAPYGQLPACSLALGSDTPDWARHPRHTPVSSNLLQSAGSVSLCLEPPRLLNVNHQLYTGFFFSLILLHICSQCPFLL